MFRLFESGCFTQVLLYSNHQLKINKYIGLNDENPENKKYILVTLPLFFVLKISTGFNVCVRLNFLMEPNDMNPDQTAWETGSTQDWPGQRFIQKILSGNNIRKGWI